MPLPRLLAQIVTDFRAAPDDLRIELLLDYAERLPPLPPELAGDPDRLERVVECQAPFFLASTVHADGRVEAWFDCPPEAPTTRAFAGILAESLCGATVDEVLGLPDDVAEQMGLDIVISPLRLRSMAAIVRRLKRQVREAAGA